VGVLIGHSFDVHLLQRVLKIVIKQILIYGGSFYIASYLLREVLFPRFDLPKDRTMAEQFTGYGSALIYVVAMIQALIPSLFLLRILIFFTFYILWTGGEHFLKIGEERLVRFTLFGGLVVLFAPALIEWVVGGLMPGMR
jgi:hypothetical protein